jgi:hypothetical protein
VKHIGTLVKDIQEVLTGVHAPTESAVREFASALAAKLVERLCNRGANDQLRMSNYAMPDRKLWYTVNKSEWAEPIPPEARLKFLLAEISEHLMLFLAEAAGHKVTNKQMEVTKHGVVGHIDGVIDGVVVDVKSTTGRQFDKFKYHLLDSDDPFGYRDQLSLYVDSAKDLPDVTVKKQGAFLAFSRELGYITLDTYTNKETDYEKETVRKRGMLTQHTPPPRCYLPVPEGRSGNLKLGVECSYCPFKTKCWASANGGRGLRVFQYAKGPVFLTHVAEEPRVPEGDVRHPEPGNDQKGSKETTRSTDEDPQIH